MIPTDPERLRPGTLCLAHCRIQLRAKPTIDDVIDGGVILNGDVFLVVSRKDHGTQPEKWTWIYVNNLNDGNWGWRLLQKQSTFALEVISVE